MAFYAVGFLDIECTFVLYDLISRLFLGSNACVLGLTDSLGQLSEKTIGPKVAFAGLV